MNKLNLFNKRMIKNDQYLWKFLTIDKFLSMILNEKFYLSRLDCMEDSLEGISSDHLMHGSIKKDVLESDILRQFTDIGIGVTVDPKETKEFNNQLNDSQLSNFATCMFLSDNNEESYALWQLYSKPNSVALRIRFDDFYSKLSNSGYNCPIIESLMLGKMNYVDFQNKDELRKMKNVQFPEIFVKDISYNFEKEFRIAASVKKQQYKQNKDDCFSEVREKLIEMIYNPKGIDVILNDFRNYKFEIVFHPQTESWIQDDIKKLLENLDIKFPCKPSNLKLRKKICA